MFWDDFWVILASFYGNVVRFWLIQEINFSKKILNCDAEFSSNLKHLPYDYWFLILKKYLDIESEKMRFIPM